MRYETQITWPEEPEVIPMGAMKPGEIGKIVNCNPGRGFLVMRCHSTDNPQVINLTEPGTDRCWCWTKNSEGPTIDVELLPKGTVVALTVKS